MYFKLIKNDIKNNLLQTLNIALFIILSVAFLSSAGQLSVQLVTSIDKLFDTAKTPHLLQMHTGDIDRVRLQNFVFSQDAIEEFQVLKFLNIDNSKLAFNDNSLKDSVYDNGFSTQSKDFDYLLDMKGNIINARQGEVYVPIIYQTAGLAKEGDILTINDYHMKVAGFVRDSQMNSSLSVSRRFIVSEDDYNTIEKFGTVEYLIEFRVNDLSKIPEVEKAYGEGKLEADGPPFMTYTLFKIVNSISDGVIIVSLAFISILIICICLICIRLTLLAKLEEDYRELSVLKAIGIPYKEIRKIFLSKYLFIAGISTIIGFLLSFAVKTPFLSNMKMFFGENADSALTYGVGIAMSMLIFLIIYLNMNKLAKQLKKLSLNPALVNEEDKNSKLISKFPQDIRLALSDILSRKKIYATMITVFVLSIFVLTVPMTIYTTITDKYFVNYLGIGAYDVRFDVAQLSGKEEEIQDIINDFGKDESIEKFNVYKSKLVDYKKENNTVENLWVDFKSEDSFPIKYIVGQAPTGENEIALSKLKSDDIQKNVGDKMTLVIDGVEEQFTVSGIFSDLTNGGKTARVGFETNDENVIWMIIPIKLKDGTSVKEFLEKYQNKYSIGKFSDVQKYLDQILGNTVGMIKNITIVSFVASIFLVFLITVLFIRMLYLKDSGQNALIKSIGFTNKQISRQYLIKSTAILILGFVIGSTLSATVGDAIGSGALSIIGVDGVDFIRNILFSYILVPICLLISTLVATNVAITGLKNINISQLLKEDV